MVNNFFSINTWTWIATIINLSLLILIIILIYKLIKILFANNKGYIILENNSGTILKDVEINYIHNQTSIKIDNLETNKKYKFKIVAESDDSINISYIHNGIKTSITEFYVFKGINNQYVSIIYDNNKIIVKN